MGLQFEWDVRKARTNFAKHGVAFEEAATVFGDAAALTIPDPAHSAAEPRFVTLGRSVGGKMLVVIHTERGDNLLRLISARPASRKERRQYADLPS